MRVKLLILIALCWWQLPKLHAQALTVSDLIGYAASIPKPFNTDDSSLASVNRFVLNRIANGYVISSYTDTSKYINNKIVAKSAHVLVSTQDGAHDKIVIRTSINDGSGYLNNCTISFETPDFDKFKAWIAEMPTIGGYTLSGLNSSGSYRYKNNQNGKEIMIGYLARFTESGGGTDHAEATEVITPYQYYCRISYH